MNIKAQRWVATFNAYPTDMIAKLMAIEEDFDKWEEIEPNENDYDILPMWGTMWAFDSFDDYWLEAKGGLRKMRELGFRIYHHSDWGYFFGIDGAGFDFYEAYWVPLYKARFEEDEIQ